MAQLDNTRDLSFKDDPGAVRHGNFINYYKFHGAQERIQSIPTRVVRNLLQERIQPQDQQIYALDLGCNTGEITQGLHKMLHDFQIKDQVKILGLDIDPALIQRATESNANPEAIQFQCADLMESLSRAQRLQNFTNNRSSFHLVACLSLTMWIHLNNGDLGLQLFLKRVAAISDILIIEPQRWKNYRDAVRRMKRGAGLENAFPHFPELKWRETVEDDIQRFLESKECNMRLVEQTEPSSWGRTISVYAKEAD